MNYYNEIDPFAAEWLANLIAERLIPDGKIDTRSIAEVQPADLDGFTQCHFFAGIGGWPLALALAGWPSTRPVFTGSCPCQPFSCAGKGAGEADARHLWPEFRRLIAARKPATVFGEQVTSALGRAWLDSVCTDLEALGYEAAGADLCAAGTGAPHIRQRLFWMADAELSKRRTQHGSGENECDRPDVGREKAHGELGACCEVCRMADAEHERDRTGTPRQGRRVEPANGSNPCRMDDAQRPRLEGQQRNGDNRDESGRDHAQPHKPIAPTSGANPWFDCEWIYCRDEVFRPTQPCLFPLAYGLPRSLGPLRAEFDRMGIRPRDVSRNRIGRLKGYGNAIVPQVAATFIRAYLEL